MILLTARVQPWMTPRYVPDLQGYRFTLVSGGGVTIFCHARDAKEGDFTVSWGQTATYGELALGEGAVRSRVGSLSSRWR